MLNLNLKTFPRVKKYPSTGFRSLVFIVVHVCLFKHRYSLAASKQLVGAVCMRNFHQGGLSRVQTS